MIGIGKVMISWVTPMNKRISDYVPCDVTAEETGEVFHAAPCGEEDTALYLVGFESKYDTIHGHVTENEIRRSGPGRIIRYLPFVLFRVSHEGRCFVTEAGHFEICNDCGQENNSSCCCQDCRRQSIFTKIPTLSSNDTSDRNVPNSSACDHQASQQEYQTDYPG